MRYNRIVILTGAGISAESGLATFRGSNGMWNNRNVDDVASPAGYENDPGLVHQFYNERRAELKTVEPNAAHIALAELAEHFEGRITLVTQNIDNLHDRALQGRVLKSDFRLIHTHGELNKVRCTKTEEVYDWQEDVTTDSRCACCNETGTLRPHVVFFREDTFDLGDIHAALRTCNLFVSIGTSGLVRPAKDFVGIPKGRCATLKLNFEAATDKGKFDREIYGPATEIVPEFVKGLLEDRINIPIKKEQHYFIPP